MIIGIPKEIKDNENRVAIIPGSVSQLAKNNTVYVQKGAGLGSGFTDADYEEAGAEILETAKEVWEKAEMIYKVKEPLEEEYQYFREGLILYTYLHLASNLELAQKLVDTGVIGIGYETVQLEDRSLPLLRPMSEIAGRMAVQEGARYLTSPEGGRGILMQGVPGVRPANVVIVGAGTVGTAATRIAVGMGARVTVLDVNIDALTELTNIFQDKVETLYSNPLNIEEATRNADLVISTVLIPGRKAPQLIKEDYVKEMKKGSVIVDVAIDQGGSTDLTKGHPTSHSDPTFIKHDVIHYAVANIPGAVAMTSTYALSNATTRYAKAIADMGVEEACQRFPELESGINTYKGHVTYQPVAEDLGLEYKELDFAE